MKNKIKYLFLFAFLFSAISLYSISSNRMRAYAPISLLDTEQPQDTTTRFPVKKTQDETSKDLNQKRPIDLEDPSNLKTRVEYDEKENHYLFQSKIGNEDWKTLFYLSPEEYQKFTLKQSMSEYFKKKNNDAFSKTLTTDTKNTKSKPEDFDFKNIKLDLGAADKIFGPGGVQLKTQGYTEITMGLKQSSSQNPTLSERNKNRTMFDFNQKIQLNVNASVGDKINFGMNYDTEATFGFDTKKIKLAYEGKEDEIIKHLEAGNVSMQTTNSLINGGAALFGIRTDLQFGKLKINTVISQQESQAQTVNSKGGVQTMPFEFKADQYDENRHFFLSQYFRDKYDYGMSKLPFVQSSVTITKIEVWITNRSSNFDNARNFVAFADIGEFDKIKNPTWIKQGVDPNPYNNANNLYSTMNTSYPTARDISQTNNVLGGFLQSGLDYEKVESARLLTSSEYTFSPQLGYISLLSPLQSDEVLAVAFRYTMGGKTYQVGEFASDITARYDASNPNSGALFLKLLKPVALTPHSYSWDLMMKNIYSLGATQVQKDLFRLKISYQSDTAGTYIDYIPEGKIKNQMLLKVMTLDRLDAQNNTHPDGIFDYLEGYTVVSANGQIIFPEVEPFGSHLRTEIGDDAIADKYVYQELYDSTLTVARQLANKNKFKISGTFKASNNNIISLNATNVARGSVKVTAAGVELQEGSQYTVDYISGTVTILDQSILSAGTPVSISLENQNVFSMQRKTMEGINLSYDFTKNFNVGMTLMHLSEKPLTTNSTIGDESVSNTLWGVNTSYRTQSQWLTNLVDKLPFVNATQPSQISLNAEFAKMNPGHYHDKYMGNYSYLDDFENAKTEIDIHDPYSWKLASTPADRSANALFPEALLSDSIDYGKNRAKLAWFTIDNIFTNPNSSLTPQYLKQDKDQLSNHFVRQINMSEIYPNKQALYNQSSTINALNLSYYPSERGAYNLDEDVDSNGNLLHPEKRWGGIMRKLNSTDFETTNVQYIEFWLMDPFVYNDTATVKNEGGDLYFNLGEISEDILKDGKKFYENGLPVDGDPSAYETTTWGRVPSRTSTVYAFNSGQTMDELRKQDVGFNGLSDAGEADFPTYKRYINALKTKVSATALANIMQDPAGDDYHYYRGSDYDRDQVSILDRYKKYNGVEGNTYGFANINESYSTAATSLPDAEDINQDYTMNESESYFQYKVQLTPSKMQVGMNDIVDSRTVNVKLANGTTSPITWYQFKVPINNYDKRVGNIQDFRSVRFMRMFLTDFKQPTYLRFATLQLARGEWRTYTDNLNLNTSMGQGTLDMSTVSIEENGDREPVNYVLPPGINRILDPSQPQVVQQNEQSLSIAVNNLDPDDSRAVYKNSNYDLRRYKQLQMFTHAESVIGKNDLNKGEMTVFLRLGSDYTNNYYEYEIPLTITPAGSYNTNNSNDQAIVWPQDNMFDFPLKLLTDLKSDRNKEKRKAGSTVSYTTKYSGYDPNKPGNKISVVGNPSLSDVKIMMIGIRNNSRSVQSGNVWVDDLRLGDFDEQGGWAAQGNLNIALSDLGSVNFIGRKETVGFGALDQGLMERRQDDYTSYSVTTNINLGRLLPEKAKVSIPLYYAYSKQITTPQYDPLDQDITLKQSLGNVNTAAERDSIKNLADSRIVTKNLSLSNVKVNIQSKNPMPYDPANFSFGYAYNITETSNPTTVYDFVKDYSGNLSYSYSPNHKPWEPFKNSTGKGAISKFARSLGFNYLPNNIAFNNYLTRYYSETLTRDLESYSIGGNNNDHNFLSWSQTFYWDRSFNLSWDFTKNLSMNIKTGTRAQIEEPYLQVNKKLNRSDYQIWKDSVQQSILSLGRPLAYKQTAMLTYRLPFNNIPMLDWINSSANYTSNYRWDRGADAEDASYEVGNAMVNDMTLSGNAHFNMVSLYNKSSFLKEVNQKFGMLHGRNLSRDRMNKKKPPARKPKPFVTEIRLTGKSLIIKHNLNTKNLRIVAKSGTKIYKIKYKTLDANSIQINNKDSVELKLNIVQAPDPKEGTLYKIAQYTARGLMSLRSVSINVSSHQETDITGYRGVVGNAFGQSNGANGLTPGLGFAFGFDGGESFVNKSLSNNMFVISDMNVSPAVYNSAIHVDAKAAIEPFRGFKIDLNALYEKNDRTEFQYMYEGVPKTYGGSLSMTTIGLSSALKSSKASDGYHSEAFDKFLTNREIITARLENEYAGTKYPNSGFIADQVGIAGKDYDPNTFGGVNPNSSDVMVPAFIAAYTGKDANSMSTSPFPTLLSMLPNWTITYDGLTTLPWFKDKFRSFKLKHAYTCLYQIGTYNSYSDWVQSDGSDGLGFICNPLNSSPTPSSVYDIGSVNLTEAFNPLFGAEGTLKSGMTVRAKYNTQRTVSLNIASYQIVEALIHELVVGMGYQINEFNRVIGLKTKSTKGFNNSLVINVNFSKASNKALIRDIDNNYTQATSGSSILSVNASADYSLSKSLSLKAFFDRVMNSPLVSSSSYPTTNTNFGLSLRFSLSQ